MAGCGTCATLHPPTGERERFRAPPLGGRTHSALPRVGGAACYFLDEVKGEPMTLTPIPRDVLEMLLAELRLAKQGETRLVQTPRGKPDPDYVEMLEDTIAEIQRLRWIAGSPTNQT